MSSSAKTSRFFFVQARKQAEQSEAAEGEGQEEAEEFLDSRIRPLRMIGMVGTLSTVPAVNNLRRNAGSDDQHSSPGRCLDSFGDCGTAWS
jgi:hypothetical protein